MKILVLTEKPSVSESLAHALDPKCSKTKEAYVAGNYVVTWAFGHLLHLANPEDYDPKYKRWTMSDLPIIPKKFVLVPNAEAKQRLDELKKMMSDSSFNYVVDACDAGREGELIFRNIYNYVGCSLPMRRLWLSSYTDEAIRKAFAAIADGEQYDALYRAAVARSFSDWLIGINGSRAICVRNPGKRLTLGRVQTPVLTMITDREREIEAFTAAKFYEAEAPFVVSDGEQSYAGTWMLNGLTRLEHRADAAIVVQRCSNKPAMVAKVEHKDSKLAVPPLFDLALLQREANTMYGFSAAMTLKLTQALYEDHKAVTYPRTDSKYLPDDMKGEVDAIMRALGKVTDLKGFVDNAQASGYKMRAIVFNSAKVTDHFAIIPTKKVPGTGILTKDEERIYNLVARRFLAQYYPDAIVTNSKIETRIGTDLFLTEGKAIKTVGWLSVSPKEQDVKSVPLLKIGDAVKCGEIKIAEKTTKAPARYTDATIIQAMETAGKHVDDEDLAEALKERGLGTPATRSEIIERLIKSTLIERKQKSLVPTRMGMDTILLISNIGLEFLTSPAMTGEWERDLRNIEKDQLSDTHFMEVIVNQTEEMVESIRTYDAEESGEISSNESVGKCPICGSDVIKRKGGFGCSNYGGRGKGGCEFFIYESMAGRMWKEKEIKELLANNKIDGLKGFTSKAGKKFDATVALDEAGKTTFVFDNTSSGGEVLGKCPICGSNVVERKFGFVCEKHGTGDGNGCEFIIFKNMAGRPWKAAEIRKLLVDKKTPKLTGFMSKAGKNFDAVVTLNDKGKTEFLFETSGPKLPPGSNQPVVQCPHCHQHDLVEGDYKYKCECGYEINRIIAGKEITHEILEQLVANGETEVIDGFHSNKSGKDFSAKLILESGTDAVKFMF